MSSAFVKEDEDEWLHDLAPTTGALINYLTRENNGVRVYEKSVRVDTKSGKPVYEMSNGFLYTVDNNNKWMIVD